MVMHYANQQVKTRHSVIRKKEKIFHFTHLNANGVSGLADLGYRGAAWRQDHEKLIDRLAGTHRIVRACVPLMLSVGLLPAELPLE
jgi:hypothetical protein